MAAPTWRRVRSAGPNQPLVPGRSLPCRPATATRSIKLEEARRLACLYDRSVPLERSTLRAALRLADIGPDERLLDVATGTGALLRDLAGTATDRVHAVGIDRSAAMLSVAASRPATAWPLVEADARALPFADASFDVVSWQQRSHPDWYSWPGRLISPPGPRPAPGR